MDDFDIPIFKKTYDLYKTFHGYRTTVPKGDRYTIWQRSEDALLDLFKGILLASRSRKPEKAIILERASTDLNLLRVFLRLMKEVRTIDNKKYATLEAFVDEIGRMLGGWLKSVESR